MERRIANLAEHLNKRGGICQDVFHVPKMQAVKCNPTAADATHVVKGACNCGKVSYTATLSGDALPVIFCHCQDCREAHGSPYTTVFIAKSDQVVWDGEDTMLKYNRSGSNIRNFCSTCGAHMTSHLHKSGRFALFTPSIKIHVPRKPKMHIYVGEKDPDILIPVDGLPQMEAGGGSKRLN